MKRALDVIVVAAILAILIGVVNDAAQTQLADLKDQQRGSNMVLGLLCQHVVRLLEQPPYAGLQAVSVKVEVDAGSGSGVLVTRRVGNVTRSFVWTAGHVVADQREKAKFKEVTIYRERRINGVVVGVERTPAAVVAYSNAETGDDLAILEIQRDNYSNITAIFDTADVPRVGTPLIHVGCTLGLFNSVSQGVISQTDRNLLGVGKTFDQTSCMGYPGSSGGGVYSARTGACVGLLARSAGAGLNFIVPVRRIRAWARERGLEWALDPSIPVPTKTSVVFPPIDDTAECHRAGNQSKFPVLPVSQ